MSISGTPSKTSCIALWAHLRRGARVVTGVLFALTVAAGVASCGHHSPGATTGPPPPSPLMITANDKQDACARVNIANRDREDATVRCALHPSVETECRERIEKDWEANSEQRRKDIAICHTPIENVSN